MSDTARCMAGMLAEAVSLRGLSQRQFADLVGVSTKHVCLVFNGKATALPSTLDKWAAALRVRFVVGLEATDEALYHSQQVFAERVKAL